MPFIIERNDITLMGVDAIVNAANNSLLGGGGVDGAIHRAAGRGLYEECLKLGGCETGGAKVTSAYDLPCKYVIHTVGPVWRGGEYGEEGLLRSCYRESLAIAANLGCESLAFPLISAGAYGYPRREALKIAEQEIRAFLDEHDMTVYLVIFDGKSFEMGTELFGELKSYLQANYFDIHAEPEYHVHNRYELAKQSAVEQAYPRPKQEPESPLPGSYAPASSKPASKPGWLKPGPPKHEANTVCGAMPALYDECDASVMQDSLDDALNNLDESFSQNLMRRVIASGMTDAECYKRANIDRKLFSKIRNDKLYRPSKPTVFAFAVALKLDIEGTNDLMRRAGFAISHSSKFDVIVEYFIKNGRYDIFEINEALFEFDQPLLGG